MRDGRTLWAGGALAAGLLALAACAPVQPPRAPAPMAAPPPAPVASAASQALSARYAAVQARLLDNGLLRTDGGGEDTPFTDAMLARAFLSVAFFEEFSGGEITGQRNAIPLQRWNGPIRVSLQIGASVPPDQAAADRVMVSSYLARLSRLTGLPITLNASNPNFFIHIGSLEERAALGPKIAAEMPGLTDSQLAAATHMPDSAYCQVLSQSDGDSPIYTRAAAVIPAEHPLLLMQTCLHEELAQALGLPNDSNIARPSIFNDDQEFALLTRMDELMLRILYSPDLRPGMTAEEARPVVESLATRLMDGQT
ncbi:DUF2927 domain-containing protein [Stagnihabitans tardus]|uniref:DUF2927 domain-containing protein n=1 Tax=Stagnihabitans tardus TaxID=2699202 RepID=A0AAE5BWV1_9RHOB|nr:DUF2927 domain-containing protein [Stagnihabitans tardus]NBZ88653.1 DUF2927 domain-containing protein [Stagnihabitans tardus]